ncbi:MAG: undecaprenyl-diphosphate phosphatase [Christensenellales bacterium]
MEIWEAILLGLVQGFTEFLPISSSGHLVLVQDVLGIASDNILLFDTLLHLSTLVAVCVALRKQLLAIVEQPAKPLLLLVLASIPAGIAGLALSDKIESLFSTSKYLWIFFLISAVLLIASDFFPNKSTRQNDSWSFNSIGIKQALAMGLMQAIAIFPGISRSGSTIVGGIATKGQRRDVTDFSFLMSIPIILASLLLQALKIFKGECSLSLPPLATALGMLAAIVSGYLSIKVMLGLVQKCKLRYFGIYLIALSVVVLLDNFICLW